MSASRPCATKAAWAEWATLKGRQSGDRSAWAAVQVMIDLLKAYEHVQHARPLSAAQRTGSPHRQLKPCVELYRAPRRLAVGQVLSHEIVTEQC